MPHLATDHTGAENRNPHLSVGVLGCTGRVGKLITHELQARHFGAGVSLAGGTVRPDMPHENDFPTFEDPKDLFEIADVLIDFTKPEATSKHIWLAAKSKKPLIIGTTGLSAAQEKEIEDASKETAILQSANMSLGVNLLMALVRQASARLDENWDIEIHETHHKHKIDSPSGTALALGNAAAKGRNAELANLKTSPDRNGERKIGSIGFSVQRGGDVAGEHLVSFLAEGERLELAHKASDRSIFAKGAIRAAIWLKDKPAGLYTMQDMLEIA